MSRKPIQAPSSSSSSLSTLDLLFPEAMSVNTLLKHLIQVLRLILDTVFCKFAIDYQLNWLLLQMGFHESELVSSTHGDLSRLYRQHVMPKPRRNLSEVASPVAKSWMEEMELDVADDQDEEENNKNKPKSAFAFAGIKRRQDSSG